jgi:hypothetical protein
VGTGFLYLSSTVHTAARLANLSACAASVEEPLKGDTVDPDTASEKETPPTLVTVTVVCHVDEEPMVKYILETVQGPNCFGRRKKSSADFVALRADPT